VKRNLSIYFAVFAVAVGLIAPLNLAYAESESSRRFESYAELSAEWWQWAVSIPASVNPLVANGDNCMVGQHGEVWFLSGLFGSGGTVTRTCSVPQNVPLYFPLINSVQINTPDICGQTQILSVEELRANAAPFIDGASNLSVELDGVPIEHFKRVRSKVFEVALPQDNIFNALCGGPGTVPAGIYSPSVDDGYYVRLNRLKAGTHTLHIHAENPSQRFTEDVTYTLNVVPLVLSSKDKDKHEDHD
jgi:hypothetical protein